jgi:hypothetical protein
MNLSKRSNLLLTHKHTYSKYEWVTKKISTKRKRRWNRREKYGTIKLTDRRTYDWN